MCSEIRFRTKKAKKWWTNPYAHFTMYIRPCIWPLFSKLQKTNNCSEKLNIKLFRLRKKIKMYWIFLLHTFWTGVFTPILAEVEKKSKVRLTPNQRLCYVIEQTRIIQCPSVNVKEYRGASLTLHPESSSGNRAV